MVDNYYRASELLTFKTIENSVFCSYEHYILLYGEPKLELLNLIQTHYPSFSLSFNKEWLPFIQSYFSECTLVEKSIEGRNYNNFVCMELSPKKFMQLSQESDLPDIVDLDEKKHGSFLNLSRKLKISRGLGGSCIIINNSIVAVGFIPHLVQNEYFSFCVLRDVWVDKEFRGKGFGKAIVRHLCSKAIKSNVKRIFLWVERENAPAFSLYTKLGFEEKDEVYAFICTLNRAKN